MRANGLVDRTMYRWRCPALAPRVAHWYDSIRAIDESCASRFGRARGAAALLALSSVGRRTDGYFWFNTTYEH